MVGGAYRGYSEDTTADNVSSPKVKASGGYSEDTQILTLDDVGYSRSPLAPSYVGLSLENGV